MKLKPIFKLFSLKGIGQTVIQPQMSTFFISLGVLLLAFVLAACGPIASNAAPADAPTKPAEATTAAFPTGKFLREDSKSRGLQFNKDGTFLVLEGTSHFVEGTYSVKGDVYTEESNNHGCPTPMRYNYTFDGVNLKFQPVEDPSKDPCAGRKGDFNKTVTWMLTQ